MSEIEDQIDASSDEMYQIRDRAVFLEAENTKLHADNVALKKDISDMRGKMLAVVKGQECITWCPIYDALKSELSRLMERVKEFENESVGPMAWETLQWEKSENARLRGVLGEARDE